MENQKDDDQIDLTKLLGALLDHKWWIISSTLLFGLLGVAYSLLATPIYTANASIQVEEKNGNSMMKGLDALFEQQSSASTEIAVLKSRMVLGKTVEELNLATSVEPIYAIPFISKGFNRLFGEKPEIFISHFSVENSDYEKLVLEISTEPNSYHLYSTEKQLLLEGKVGRKYVTDNFAIQVSQLKGSAGQRFNVVKNNDLEVIEDLKKNLAIAEQGKQTGVIDISFNGENPRQIEKVVRSVSENYILQNIARNSDEASKSLAFLQNRLPEVREKLAASENKLNEYLQKNGSVDLNIEVKSILDTLVQIESELNELAIKETEIARKFTKRHPTYTALLEQRRFLEGEKERLNAQVGELPDTQKEVIRLKRDLEVDQEIYIQLLNKVQELDIVKAGIIGNVRILDVSQVMPKPVSPKKLIVIALSLVVGLFLGVLFALAKTLFHRGIESATEVEEIGLPTYATIPFSNHQINLNADDVRKNPAMLRNVKLLSEASPADLSVEALRSLRTSLHFAMLEANNNIVMLTGASPSVGKSFVASNLANVIHKTGQKVLLIDVDLRRSYLSYLFNVEKRKVGLVEYLSQDLTAEDIVQPTQYGFDLIVKGGNAPNPSELLASRRCQELLAWASKHYDLVILDTPPILAVTDAAVIGRYVGTTLLIGRFEQTTVREVSLARQAFERAGVTIKGFILNGVKRKASNRYDYYHYEYKNNGD